MDADETAGHDNVCTKPPVKRASNRHKGVQDVITDHLGGKNSVVNQEEWSLITAQSYYGDYYEAKATNQAAVPLGGDFEDDELAPAAIGQPGAALGKIAHPDFIVVKKALNDLTDGKKILVDVTITGPNNQNRNKAQVTAGSMAQAAETRKIQQVIAKWNVASRPNFEFRPFAVENTGGFGVHARDLLYEMLDIPKPPPLEAQTHDAVGKRHERTEKLDALWRIKAAIVAAVWRGNHYIYTEYIRAMKALTPPPGAYQPGQD